MPLGPNSKSNVGIRRVVGSLSPPQERNFEVNGQQLYRVASTIPYTYGAVSYPPGATIPFDGTGKYTAWAQLRRDFNRLVVDPID
jgi:hypothetical protein